MRKNEARKEAIIESSGNVFSDLGFDDAEAQVLALRADLMAMLAKQLKDQNMTQVHADVRAYCKSRPNTICMTHMSHVYPQGAK